MLQVPRTAQKWGYKGLPRALCRIPITLSGCQDRCSTAEVQRTSEGQTALLQRGGTAVVPLSEEHSHISGLEGQRLLFRPGGLTGSQTLTPALIYAGARSIVGTLWPILGADGARFSTYFYEALLENGNARICRVERQSPMSRELYRVPS
jgi:hypothetical protein